MDRASDRARRPRAALAVRALLSFLFPDACVACGRALAADEAHACGSCWDAVRASALSSGGVADVACGLPVHYFVPFDGPVRELLHALKYDFRASIAGELVSIVLPAARGVTRGRVDAVVPVPLHRVRYRERGFNQAELIARHLAAGLDVPLLPGLVRTRDTPSQTRMRRRERLASI